MWMVEPQSLCGRLGDKSLVTVGNLKANPRTHNLQPSRYTTAIPDTIYKANQYDAF